VVEDKEKKEDLMEVIEILLRTTEELKTAMHPLIKDQADVFKILMSHEEAIASLMSRLIGSQEDHKKRIEALELLETHVSKVEEKQLAHDSLYRILDQRLYRIERAPMARIVMKLDRQEEVTHDDLKTVELLLLSYPADEQALGIKAGILDRLERKQEALKFVEESLSKNPRYAFLWLHKGLLQEDFNEKLKSLATALEILKDGPANKQHVVLHYRASQFAKAKMFKEALEDASKSVELRPTCDKAWILKGIILFDLGRIPEALGCSEKAIEINGNSENAWFLKATILAALKPQQTDAALASFDKVIDLAPKNARAFFNKGKLLAAQSKDQEAVRTLDKGLEIDNKEPCAWCERGAALNRLGRNDEALESLTKAIDLVPPKHCGQVFMDMAIVLNYNKRFEEGVAFARKAIELGPEKAMFWSVLAGNLKDLGKEEDALEAYKKALRLKKDDDEIDWEDLAELYEKMGKAEEAKQAHEKSETLEKRENKKEGL
jgi:tetratricopeptide (TPR) repeat protein